MVRKWIVAALLMMSFCLPTLGQALADKIPADAVFYVGWSGSDAQAGAYDKSNLKKLVDQTSLEKNLGELIPLAIKRLEKQYSPGAAEYAMIQSASELLPVLWHKPCAIYVGKPALLLQGAVSVDNALVCDAGESAGEMLKKAKGIVEKSRAPIKIEQVAGRYIVLSVVSEAPVSLKNLLVENQGDSLSGNAAFKNALAKTSAGGMATVYVDSAKLTTAIDELVPKEVKSIWNTVKTAYAPDSIKRVMATCGFDGSDWVTNMYIEAPAPRRGFASWLDSKPLSGDLLKQLPADSTYAAGMRLNLNNMVYTGLSIASLYEPTIQQQFNRLMRDMKDEMGVHLQDDLLASLGEEWGAFMSPSAGGDTALGLVFVNRLADPEKFLEAVKKLETVANAELEKNFKGQRMTVEIRTVKIGGHEVHYLATPFAAPTFAVREGTLYVSLYPQSVVGALDYAAGNGKGIADNPNFVAIQKRLGAGNPTSFSYMDLPALAPDSYGIALVAERAAVGYMDIAGIAMPEPMMPTLPQIMKVIAPSGSASWQDDTGIYRRSVTPFPMANLLGTQAGNFTTSGPILAGFAIPMLSNARENAMRVSCMSNLRQIGMTIELYKADNRKMPASLGEAAAIANLPPRVLVCPRSGKAAPERLKPEDYVKWVNENTDYVYLGAGMKVDMRGGVVQRIVVAHEKPGIHSNGVNVLFADGHVEFCSIVRFEQMLAESKKLVEQAK